MAVTIEAGSTLTERYQTTVPQTVRRVLRLGKHDKLHYRVRSNGEVVLSRAEVPQDEDPVINRFLDFLAHDIADHPDRLQTINSDFVKRVKSLVGDVGVDLDSLLEADDE